MSLTTQDLSKIRQIVKAEVQIEINGQVEPLRKYVEKLPTRNEFEDLKADIADLKATLPTKDEFYTAMDELMGEVKAIREEQPLLAHHVHDHEKRITKLESHLAI